MAYHARVNCVIQVLRRSNALNVNLFLTELQWHALNNILTTTYFLLLLIHLQVRVRAAAAARLPRPSARFGMPRP